MDESGACGSAIQQFTDATNTETPRAALTCGKGDGTRATQDTKNRPLREDAYIYTDMTAALPRDTPRLTLRTKPEGRFPSDHPTHRRKDRRLPDSDVTSGRCGDDRRSGEPVEQALHIALQARREHLGRQIGPPPRPAVASARSIRRAAAPRPRSAPRAQGPSPPTYASPPGRGHRLPLRPGVERTDLTDAENGRQRLPEAGARRDDVHFDTSLSPEGWIRRSFAPGQASRARKQHSRAAFELARQTRSTS